MLERARVSHKRGFGDVLTDCIPGKPSVAVAAHAVVHRELRALFADYFEECHSWCRGSWRSMRWEPLRPVI